MHIFGKCVQNTHTIHVSHKKEKTTNSEMEKKKESRFALCSWSHSDKDFNYSQYRFL